MSKQTFLVILACGANHTVEADAFSVDKGEANFVCDSRTVAYFHSVTSVVVQPAPSAPVAGGGLHELGEPGQLVSFDAGPKVEIGALNITCGTADIAASVGQAMQALMGVRERSTPD